MHPVLARDGDLFGLVVDAAGVGSPFTEVQRAAASAVQVDLQARVASRPHPPDADPRRCPRGHECRRIADREFPASHIHAQMRLTHLEEGLDAEQRVEEGIDLGERIADLGGPQIRRRKPSLGDDLGMLAQAHIEMQAGRVEDPSPLLARAMRLDEEPLAGEGVVRDEIFFGVLAGLLQDIQLLRQLQRGSLDAA